MKHTKEITTQLMAYFLLFIVLLTPHAYALAISGITIENIQTNSATVKWQTDEDANSAVNYGKTKTNLTNTTDETKTTNHTITLTGLENNTKYYYSIASENETDNNGGAYYSFKTQATTITQTTANETIEENITYIFRGVPPISLSSIPSLTKEKNLTIKGTSQQNAVIRFFINDHKIPEQILETGQFSLKVGANGTFSATIQLVEGYYNETIGMNKIKIEGTIETTNYYRNYAYLQTIFDTTPPRLYLSRIPTATNNRTVAITGTTSEESSIDIMINNATQKTAQTTNMTFTATVSLSEGNNTIRIIARDKANNTEEFMQKTLLDTTPPTINLDKLEDIYHFSIATIRGNTSEPNTKVEAYNTGAERVRVEASTVNVSTIRLGRQENMTTGEGLDILGSIVGYKKETTSDENGKFEISLALINGTNNLIFIATDEAGNKATQEKIAKMEVGTGNWKIGRITTIPNEVYTDNLKNMNVEVGVLYELFYTGTQTSDIENIDITATLDGNRMDNKFITAKGSPLVLWDKEKGKASVYQEIEVKKFTGDVYKDLPDKISFAMTDRIRYRVKGLDQQFDDKLFYETAVAVEKPLKYSKFLTPEMINKSIAVLDRAEKILGTAVKVATYVNYGALATCGLSAVLVPALTTGDIQGDMGKIYLSCDRVLCPYINPVCTATTTPTEKGYQYSGNDENGKPINISVTNFGTSRPSDCPDYPDSITEGNATKKITYYTIETEREKDYLLGRNASGQEAVVLPKGFTVDESRRCGHTYEDWKNFSVTTPGCYFAEAPTYDKTKCLVNYWKGNSPIISGENPYNDIITSSMCVCTTGIQGNLENALKFTSGAKKCLQQAYWGEVRGGYCERLLAQFICDIIVYGLKRILKIAWGSIKAEKTESSWLSSYKQRASSVTTNLQERYGNFAQTRLGLSADQLAEKACVGAITGDWTDLQNLFRQAIRVPVKPIIGPLMPDSRVTAYNPFTGTVTINYLLTTGIISGGQEINGNVELWCDPTYPVPEGQTLMCPDQRIRIASKGIHVTVDGTLSENWAYSSKDSPYWANVAIMTLHYKVGEEEKTETKTEMINRKGGLIEQCHWQVLPPMIICESMVTGAEALMEMRSADRSPKASSYYQGNELGIKIDARRIGAITNETKNIKDIAVIYELMVPAGTATEQPRTETNKNNIKTEQKPFSTLETRTEDSIYMPIIQFPSETQISQVINSVILTNINYKNINLTTGEDIIIRANITLNQPGAKPEERNILEVHTKGLNDNNWDYTGNNARYVAQKNETLEEITQVIIQEDATKVSSVMLEITYKGVKTEVSASPSQGKTEQAGKFPKSENYKLTISLWEDTNQDGAIDPEKDKQVTYKGMNQTKTMTFSYNPEKTNCEAAPKLEIISPIKDRLFCKGEMQISTWDDCNDIKEINITIKAQNQLILLSSTKDFKTGLYTATIDLSQQQLKEGQEVDITATAIDSKSRTTTETQRIVYNADKCTRVTSSPH
jgi:hypothetical protein